MAEEFLEEKRRKPKGKAIRRGIIVVGILCVIGIVVTIIAMVYRNYFGTFTKYEVIKSMERNDGGFVEYSCYNNLLLKYSRDGAATIDTEMNYLWNGSYEMKDPIMDQCGNYVVVGDRGSKLVHIFNEGGVVNSITVEHPILKVQVANQGVIAVLMEEKNVIYVNLYKSNGDDIAKIKKAVITTGFPLSIALSNDGTKVVISFADFSSGSLKSNIACYNFDGVGKNETDNFVGGNIYEGEVVAKVDFITNNVVCFYKDSGFDLYSMEKKLSEEAILEEKFDTSIQSVFHSSSHVGFVLDTPEEEYKYKVVVYDLKGNQVLSKGINFDYSAISMNQEEVILYNYAECMILNLQGAVRFQSKFNSNIDYIFGTEKNRYFVVTGNEIQTIELKGAK